MKILGIDPGFGRCGFAVLEKTKTGLDLRTFGTITTAAGLPFEERLVELAADLQHVLNTHHPNIVSVEDLFFAKNVTTGIQVAHARGVILLLSQKFGCRVVHPKPNEIKLAFTGNGAADKAEMKKMAQMQFGLEKNPKIDDAADAIAAAMWAAQTLAIG